VLDPVLDARGVFGKLLVDGGADCLQIATHRQRCAWGKQAGTDDRCAGEHAAPADRFG
jgi:hypothetical protein